MLCSSICHLEGLFTSSHRTWVVSFDSTPTNTPARITEFNASRDQASAAFPPVTE